MQKWLQNEIKNTKPSKSAKVQVKNIFEGLPKNTSEEVFETLLQSKSLKLERIISNGQSTPDGKWYDQDNDEWVLLLKGSAALRFENSDKITEMHPGDYLFIAAHLKHRVEWTDKKSETVWLALHYEG